MIQRHIGENLDYKKRQNYSACRLEYIDMEAKRKCLKQKD